MNNSTTPEISPKAKHFIGTIIAILFALTALTEGWYLAFLPFLLLTLILLSRYNKTLNNIFSFIRGIRTRVIFIVLFILGALLTPRKRIDTSTSSEVIDAPMGTGKHYFDKDGKEVMIQQNDGNLSALDTTSAEYIVKKLETKKKLTKSETKQLNEAREQIELREIERKNETRIAEVKKLKQNFEENCLKSWDGSCRTLVELVEENMNDPKSFEHVETRYRIVDDYAELIMKYRGTNAFGAIVTNHVRAKVTFKCQVISVETVQ